MSKVLDFLQSHDIPYTPSGDSLKISCFNKEEHSHGDRSPSLSVDATRGIFHCWSCHISGNFAQLIGGLGYGDEIKFYLPNSRKVSYDISSLKGKNESIDFFGIGKVFDKLEEDKKKEIEFLHTRKSNLSGYLEELGRKIVDENLPPQDRKKFIQEFEKISSDPKVPEDFVQLDYHPYLSERGLPDHFCQYFEAYKHSKKHRDYIFFPIKDSFGNIKVMLGVLFNRDKLKSSGSRGEVPKMFYIDVNNPKGKISYIVMGLEHLNIDEDVYVVEGWLDYFKMRISGYNVIPLLSNNYTVFHHQILSSCRRKVFFCFDRDLGGFKTLMKCLQYVSRSNNRWYVLRINENRYKDIGDIDLIYLDKEIKSSPVTLLYNYKKYAYLLSLGRLYENKEIIESDRYTFRGDPFFSELRV